MQAFCENAAILFTSTENIFLNVFYSIS